jgi:peptidoglycan/LPS O-acetylase OafA/YrhL
MTDNSVNGSAELSKKRSSVFMRAAKTWSATEPDHPKYRPDIDGLRAIAVLSVVGFHAAPGRIPGGFIGVDIFFVISGYLISSIILRGLDAGTFTFREFYSRRIKRIFPALLLTLLACLAIGYFVLLDDQLKELAKHVAGGAGFVSNLVLWGESGYFDDTAAYKPLLHLWSLGIEEQFYIVWPLLLWLIWRQRFNFLIAILVIATASFALNIYSTGNDPVAAFYSPFTRFWELLIGAVLAYISVFKEQQLQIRSQVLSNVSSVSGLTLLTVAFVGIDVNQPFPGWWALLPTVSTAIFIWAGPDAWLNRVVLSNRVLVWFGLISFPLYLWHWPLLSFLRILEGTEVAQWKRATAVSIAIVLAWITYRLVEIPVRKKLRAKATPIVLVALMTIAGLIGCYGYFANGFEGRSGAPKIVNAGEIGQDRYFDYISERYFPCTPLDIQEDAGNWKGFVRCVQSKEGTIRDIAILGDSHAEHLFPGLAAKLADSNIVFYGKGGLPFLSNSSYRRVFESLISDKNITTVVISAFWGRDLKHYASEEWKQELTEVISILTDSGKRVYLTDDIPAFSFKPYKCKYAARLGSENKCLGPHPRVNAQYLPTFDDIASAIGHDRVQIIKTYDLFCKEETCSMARDGTLFYRDETHVNVNGSMMLGSAIAERILSN